MEKNKGGVQRGGTCRADKALRVGIMERETLRAGVGRRGAE